MTTPDETYENIRKIIWDNEDGRDSRGPAFHRQDNFDNEDLERYEAEEGNELFEEEMDPEAQEEEEQIFTVPINMVTRGVLAQADRKWKKAVELKRVRFKTVMSPDFQEQASSQRYAMGQEEYEGAVQYLETPKQWTNVETDQQKTLTQLQRPKNFKKLDKMARMLNTLTSVPGDQEVLREQYKKFFMEEQRLLSITTDVATKEEWDMAKGIFKRRKKLAELSFPGKLDGQHFNFPVIMVDDFSSQNKNIPVISIGDSESTGRREVTKLVSIAPRHQEIQEIQEVPDDGDDLNAIILSDADEYEIDEGPRDGDEEVMILDEQTFIEDIIPDEQEYQEPNLNSWQQYKRNPVRKCRTRRFEDPVYVYEEPPVVTKKRKRVRSQETHSESLEQQLITKHAALTPQKRIVPPPPPKIIEAQLFIPERLRVEEGLRIQKQQRRRLQEDQLLSIPYDEATPEQIYKAGLIQMERQKKRNQGNAFQDVYVVARKACWQSL
ncbi:unnamed protein product [Caenorhabditis brenneri]